jgi:hypothetical protein
LLRRVDDVSPFVFLFMQRFGSVVHLEDQRPHHLAQRGLAGWGLPADACELVQRFNPTQVDMPGFFIAKFLKVGAYDGQADMQRSLHEEPGCA